ncbi:MAG: ABC transporter permease subunit [Nitrospina sp.]|jgi:ABC-2 type transport system permease protein|nr:ABC transporter permease subunit [Nitrospina sp.]
MKIFTIWHKELISYFSSPMAYVIISIFTILSGYFFYTDVLYFNLYNLSQTSLTEGLWVQFFNDLRYVLIIVVPLLTMRVFSEEKKQHTLEMLLSYPVRTSELVFGKLAACMSFFILLILLTLCYPLVLSTIWTVELGPLAASYLGFILLGFLFVSSGIFISSLTENQILAAMGSYGLLLFFWFVSWNEAVANETIMRILTEISAFNHFTNFTRGVIELKDISYFMLLSAFFWALTLLSIDKSKWGRLF